MIIIAIVLCVAILFYLLRNKIVIHLFNTEKSRFIFIGSYIIKVCQAGIKEDDASIYAAIYLSNKLVNGDSNEKRTLAYDEFFQSYLVSYYDGDLVDSLNFETLKKCSDSLKGYVVSHNGQSEIEYNDKGAEKMLLAEYVIDMLAKENILSKSLDTMSKRLMSVIKEYKGEQ